MSDAMLDVLGCLLTEPVLTWCYTRIAPMRHEGLFWVARMVPVLLFAAMRAALPAPVTSFVGLIPYVIVPFAFFWGGVGRRAVATAIGVIMTLATEFFCWSLTWSLVGMETFDYASSIAHLDRYLFMHLVYNFLAMAAVLVLRRFTEPAVYHVRAGEPSTLLARFAAFPLMQAGLLIGTLAFYTVLSTELPTVHGLYYIMAAVMVLCLAVDAVLYASLLRAREAALADEGSRVLEGQLDELVAQYEGVVRQVALAGRTRHDLRNQLACAQALADGGDPGRACAHVEALRAQLAEQRTH